MGDEMLASVCELAFDVAKEGSAPSAMKNYLYLAQRPLRAYSVAERALEEDAAFRARVAERATIENVGEGGYLWLHRPAGWEQRVADIGAGVEPTPPATIQWRDSSLDVPAVAPSLSERPPMPAPPVDDDATPSILENRPSTAPAPAQPTPSTQIPSPQPPASLIPPVSATPPMQRAQESSSQPVAPRTPADSDKAVVEPPIESPRSSEPTPEPKPEPEPMTLSQPAAAPTPEQPPRTSSTVSSIEDELSSLRGLVDRLADERQNVRSSVSELEVELETRRAENLEMFSKLTSLRDELSSAQTSETSVVADRDRAFGRIAELESDVARLTADVDRMAAEADGQSSEHGAALTDLAMVSSERDALQTELAATRDAQATSVADLTALRAESDGLAQAATERDSALSELQSLKAGNDLTTAQLESARADLTALTTERDALQGELDAVTTDRNAVTAQFNDTSTERDQLRGKLESVSTERGELRSQLATAEAEGRELTERIEAMDQLRADNTELASRLSVAEQARVDLEGQLEEVSEKWKGTTRQLSVFENVNGQLDAAVAERDALQGQLGQANESLAEIQGRIGTSHDQIRSELTSIESAFGESADAPPISNAVTAPPSADTVAAEIADADAAAEIAVDASEEAAPADDDTAATDEISEPVELSEIDVADFGATDFGATDFGAAGLEVPNNDVPDFGDVDKLDAPAFGDGLSFGSDDAPSSNAQDAASDVFDGEGIELDPSVLGGRSMGDMFGGDEAESATPDDAPEIETEPAPTDAPADEQVTSTAGRRRMSIPAGLDDSAFAKAVVATPDVVLLIDGDGAAGLGWPHLDVATRRGALVDYLGTLTANSGAAADVVFARPVGGEEALPVSRAVRVRIADAAVTDSPIFGSIVDGYPEEWPIAIVTSEASLIAQAENFEATVLTSDQLLDLFLDLNSDD